MHLSDHVDHIVNPNKRSNIHWFATLAPERQSSVVLLLVGFLPSPVFLEKTPLKSTSSSIGWFRVLVKLSWFRCAGISLNLDRPTQGLGGAPRDTGGIHGNLPMLVWHFLRPKRVSKTEKKVAPKKSETKRTFTRGPNFRNPNYRKFWQLQATTFVWKSSLKLRVFLHLKKIQTKRKLQQQCEWNGLGGPTEASLAFSSASCFCNSYQENARLSSLRPWM